MIHAREDYNRIQDPENKIGIDEPVMLFRAKDIYFRKVLGFYANLLDENGNPEMAKKVYEHASASLEWVQKNGSKKPDL